MSTLAPWQRAWRAFGVATPGPLFADILNRWCEPHRHYHTLQHLGECLALLSDSRDECSQPAEVELAFWFHDAVFDPELTGNELRSAELAQSAVLQAGLSEEIASRIYDLIMATRGRVVRPLPGDARVIADIDMAILGAKQDRFWEYNHQIRQDYAHIPEYLYRAKRKRWLERYLECSRIYYTERFRRAFEASARGNIRLAIQDLS
jgi:predicted metal-dependent HD superfamily phosphohydrolase